MAVTLPALLVACEPAQTGAAVLVGNNRLSERELASETKATFTEMGPSAASGVDTSQVLQASVARYVRHELLVRAARDEGVSVSQGDIDALLAQSSTNGRAALEQQAASQAFVPPSELDEYASDVLLERKIVAKVDPKGTSDQQSAALLAVYQKTAKGLRISVSPRYGAFDLATLDVVPAPNDLSSPLGSASASPVASPAASSS
jgi:hypothetical protein